MIKFTQQFMRKAHLKRKTAETDIALTLQLDGVGESNIDTGIPFFDHMLILFAKHGGLDIELRAKGDIEVDFHHTVEDTGIVLGQCIKKALGTKAGIHRYGHAYIPMDETLVRAVIDLSNRSYLDIQAPENTPSAPNLPFTLVEEFFRALSSNLCCNLHLAVLAGRDGHHISEALFKATARALRTATSLDPQMKGIPSTKESL